MMAGRWERKAVDSCRGMRRETPDAVGEPKDRLKEEDPPRTGDVKVARRGGPGNGIRWLTGLSGAGLSWTRAPASWRLDGDTRLTAVFSPRTGGMEAARGEMTAKS